MFTGIVEETGTVTEVRPVGDGRELSIAASRTLEGLKPGDSVSIDGACHTVTRCDGNGFEVQSVATTLQRTTLGEFGAGRRVNLERALAVGDRLGGHLVQGHVDAVARVLAVVPRGEYVLIDFTLPPLVAEVTVLHGSVALNGVSLTINALPGPELAQVSIVPHTWQHTNLSELAPGAAVNLEGDLIGKYVRHLLGRPRSAEGSPSSPGSPEHLLRSWGY